MLKSNHTALVDAPLDLALVCVDMVQSMCRQTGLAGGQPCDVCAEREGRLQAMDERVARQKQVLADAITNLDVAREHQELMEQARASRPETLSDSAGPSAAAAQPGPTTAALQIQVGLHLL